MKLRVKVDLCGNNRGLPGLGIKFGFYLGFKQKLREGSFQKPREYNPALKVGEHLTSLNQKKADMTKGVCKERAM